MSKSGLTSGTVHVNFPYPNVASFPIFDQKTEKSSFSKFFWNKPYFFCLNLNSTWKMHSFDVYIVDIAQKLQNLKFFAIFWSNCTITVILQFFSAFCKKKILKMALMNWKWSQLSGKCVFGALWRSRAKLDRGGIRCPPSPGKPFQTSVWLGLTLLLLV